MPNDSFQFKQFTVRQDRCAMKVGTDGVLLGAWINTDNCQHILDIGTGSGLIALMAAQKCNAHIDAIEISQEAAEQAFENFQLSPWFSRLTVFHCSFQDFARRAYCHYDLIVSNPPYFRESSKPSGEQRQFARHNDQLPVEELILGVQKLLSPIGAFQVILPYTEGLKFMNAAAQHGLFCSAMILVKTRPEKTSKRVLLTFYKKLIPIQVSELTLLDEENRFSPEYRALTQDYYLSELINDAKT